MAYLYLITLKEGIINQEIINEGLTNLTSKYSITLTFIDGLKILTSSIFVGFLLRFLYKKYATTFSSKDNFGNSILVITISVAALIAVVKSSLALSLGLVGALSVIRFRTAVKEPYSLAFLLFAICIGISIGAAQFTFGIMTFIAGFIAVYIVYNFPNRNIIGSKDYEIDTDTLIIELPHNSNLKMLYKIIISHSYYYSIQSLEEEYNGPINLTIKIKIKSQDDFEKLRNKINDHFAHLGMSYINSPVI